MRTRLRNKALKSTLINVCEEALDVLGLKTVPSQMEYPEECSRMPTQRIPERVLDTISQEQSGLRSQLESALDPEHVGVERILAHRVNNGVTEYLVGTMGRMFLLAEYL